MPSRCVLASLALVALAARASAGYGHYKATVRADGVLVDPQGVPLPVPEREGDEPHRAQQIFTKRLEEGTPGHEDHGYYPHPSRQRAATPQGLSDVQTCVYEKGERMCLQRDVAPTCPAQFRRSALSSCYYLARFLNRGSEDDGLATEADIELWWWTNKNCSMHRLLCHVDHPTHDKQYEFSLIDFEDSCHENIGYTYQFDYNIDWEGTLYSNSVHGSHLLRHGEPERILSIRHEGKLVREEHLAILMYELDSQANILFASPGLRSRRSQASRFSSDPLGLYGQFHVMVTLMHEDGSVTQSAPSPLDYHITPYLFLSHCTANTSWIVKLKNEGKVPETSGASEEKSSSGGVDDVNKFAIIIGLIPVVACVSIAAHMYLARRRQFYANQMAQAREAETIDVQPGQAPPVMGVVVQGVSVPDGAAPVPALVAQPLPTVLATVQAPGNDVCEAAPLPPSFAAAMAPPASTTTTVTTTVVHHSPAQSPTSAPRPQV